MAELAIEHVAATHGNLLTSSVAQLAARLIALAASDHSPTLAIMLSLSLGCLRSAGPWREQPATAAKIATAAQEDPAAAACKEVASATPMCATLLLNVPVRGRKVAELPPSQDRRALGL